MKLVSILSFLAVAEAVAVPAPRGNIIQREDSMIWEDPDGNGAVEVGVGGGGKQLFSQHETAVLQTNELFLTGLEYRVQLGNYHNLGCY